MTSRDFCYWLQGFFEISEVEDMSKEQLIVIKKHLNMVFVHEIDPSMGDSEHQAKLNAIHKPTLQELGDQDGFEATDGKWGPSPGQGYVLSPLYGWYDPKYGAPRC